MSAGGRRRLGRSRLRRASTGASSPRPRPTWPTSRPACRPASRTRDLRGLQALGNGQGHPEPAEHQGRQLHPLRRRPAAATRWSATARSCRCATTTTMPWGRYNTDGVGRPLGGNWLDSNDNLGMQVGDQRARQVQHPRLLRARRRRRRRQVLDQGRRHALLATSPAPAASSRTATSTSCGSCSPRR